jgi:hypothetical protein
LRELGSAARSTTPFLFTPVQATRVRDNVFSDTPLPPEVPTGQNPPDGAIVDYYLPSTAQRVTLEILDAKGDLVRRYASDDPAEQRDTTAWYYPTYWVRPAQVLSPQPGGHRFVWNLRYRPPPGAQRELSISSTYHNTPTGPFGPLAHPGRYTVRLTVDGQVSERPLDLRMDPRVRIGLEDVQRQTDLSMASYQAYLRLQTLRDAIDAALEGANGQRRSAMMGLRGQGDPAPGDVLYGSITVMPTDQETVVGAQEKLLFMLNLLQGADARPTTQAEDAVRQLQAFVPALERRWASLGS